MLVVFGGAFLITPGFLTDIVGLLLLLPPTRVGDPRGSWPAAWAAASSPPREPFDVEGTATEYDAPARRLER